MDSKLFQKFGKFTIVPNSFIEASEVSNAAFRLFIVLRKHADNNDDNAFPSYVTLRKECGMAFTTIAKAIRELIDLGWVERVKRFNSNSIYVLKYPKSQESEQNQVLQKVEYSPPESGVQSSRKRSLTRLSKLDSNNNTSTAEGSISDAASEELMLPLLPEQDAAIEQDAVSKEDVKRWLVKFTKIDSWERAGKQARLLLEKYNVRRADITNFEEYWYHDWRWTKNKQLPTPETVKVEWQRALVFKKESNGPDQQQYAPGKAIQTPDGKIHPDGKVHKEV